MSGAYTSMHINGAAVGIDFEKVPPSIIIRAECDGAVQRAQFRTNINGQGQARIVNTAAECSELGAVWQNMTEADAVLWVAKIAAARASNKNGDGIPCVQCEGKGHEMHIGNLVCQVCGGTGRA